MPDVKERILSWEQAHTAFGEGGRDGYLKRCLDAYTGVAYQKMAATARGKRARAYPLAINYCTALVNKLNSLTWGQYEQKPDGQVITWRVPAIKENGWGSKTSTEQSRETGDLLQHVFFEANPGNIRLLQWAQDAGLYGTGILGIRYDPFSEEIVLDAISARSFHCVWNSDGSLAESLVVEDISQEEAKARYGWTPGLVQSAVKYATGAGFYGVERWVHWTPTAYNIYLDGRPVWAGGLTNPYCPVLPDGTVLPGPIPYVVLGNRTMATEVYGRSDMDAVVDLVYEINRAMALAGDIVAENAKPMRILQNARGDDDKFRVTADRIWRVNGDDAKAYMLTYEGGIPAAHQYIEDLRIAIEDTGCLPAIAYGRFHGTQGSSLMLQVEMLPALQIADWKRMVIGEALGRAAEIVLRIMAVPDPADGQARRINGKALRLSLEDALKQRIRPVFAPMLPKDDVTNTNKQISLVGAGLRSVRKALEELDEPNVDKELAEIEKDQAAAMAREVNAGGAAGAKKPAQMAPAEQTIQEEAQKEAKGEYSSGKA